MSVSNISKLLVAIIPCEQVSFSGLRSRSRGGVITDVETGSGSRLSIFQKKIDPDPGPDPDRAFYWHPSRGVSVAWLKQQHAT